LILLGFEAGTAEAVSIPLHHLVICGMTRLSGKTTALEALVTRSGSRAVAFLTKRGEDAFHSYSPIEPYFRPRSDWQYVEALIDATLGEKTKYEPGIRSAIMRVTAGTKTPEQVLAKTIEARASARKGFQEDLYTKLQAYLELVVPELQRWHFTDKLALKEGLNLMDLINMHKETQGIVIASTLEYVHEKLDHTLSLIPEAWEHMPQGYKTPVRMAAEAIARKGAVLSNFLWMDSQDLGGLEKTPLRECDIWILGKQRESNEIIRNLKAIPLPPDRKPSEDEVGRLKVGFFWASFSDQVRLVYALPSWLPEDVGKRVARGELEPTSEEVQRYKMISLSGLKPWPREPRGVAREHDEVLLQGQVETLEKQLQRVKELERQVYG